MFVVIVFPLSVHPPTCPVSRVPRKLYWLDEGGPGVPRKVAAANLDGRGSEVLVQDRLSHLDFLTIDISTQTLYWSEGHAGKVSSKT